MQSPEDDYMGIANIDIEPKDVDKTESEETIEMRAEHQYLRLMFRELTLRDMEFVQKFQQHWMNFEDEVPPRLFVGTKIDAA